MQRRKFLRTAGVGSAAVAAAAQLCGIASSGLEYSAAAGGLDPVRLADYRSMWRDAVAEHCRTGTSPGGPPW